MYGKIINNNIKAAPKSVTVNETQIWNADPEIMLSLGWKPVVFTAMPDPEPGYWYESGWKETSKKITQTWTKKEIPDEVSAEEALSAILEVLK